MALSVPKKFGPFEVRGRYSENTDRPVKISILKNNKADQDSQMIEPPRRNYNCIHYETCLNLAAALNWGSFTCGTCVGEINEALFLQAEDTLKKDKIAQTLCELDRSELTVGNPIQTIPPSNAKK